MYIHMYYARDGIFDTRRRDIEQPIYEYAMLIYITMKQVSCADRFWIG